MTENEFLKITKKDEDLSRFSTYKIGGPAKYYLEIKDKNLLINVLNYCQKNMIRYFILGGGSNILFSDRGYDGLVINIKNSEYTIKNKMVEAGAGTRLQDLVQRTVMKGLSGLEYLAGIPGSVGGAIRGNAGAYGHEVSDVVETVNILREKNGIFISEKLNHKQLNFSYRNSIIKEKGYIIFWVSLRLVLANKKELQKIVQNIIKERNEKQPYNYPSAGCVFKNIEGVGCEELEKFAIHNKVPVAKIIEELGLKGKSIGGAKISEKHANFIINKGNAKASDVLKLVHIIKEKVKEKYGIELEEEIKIVE